MSLSPLTTSGDLGWGVLCYPASPQPFPVWPVTVSPLEMTSGQPAFCSVCLPLEGDSQRPGLSLAADLSDHEVAASLKDKTIEAVRGLLAPSTRGTLGDSRPVATDRNCTLTMHWGLSHLQQQEG